ncbi:nucleotidyltransferase family protein [Wenxinia marina]|uniref:Nucleoside-diphosphate-sugar pyrophosphorylase n=1 Tax=Wenxinia marina DSM 24838 TaxID=1123501 RepID=A0A0D0PI66_9RHOB|nr:nucleotidyltransferase family protein [Wenxinia marina]KIQ71081.1 Nucleoside-diphosphate-sugar pyrophosphorylase [Wenxinia marina DSM 24838]GGL55013.1 nucleotidyltransferase [Wenxinia marina]
MSGLPLLIFAAGLGTRMGALTADRPKPLVEVAGRPLIDHALDIARTAGADPIVVNTHYRAAQLEAHLGGTSVRLSHEPLLLETGGGLRRAAPLLGPGPVWTLNSDAVWDGPNPLTALTEAWGGHRMDALLLLLPREAATGHTGSGDFVPGPDGRLARGPGLVYSGAQIVRPEALDGIAAEAFSMNVAWDRMIAGGRLYGVAWHGRWCDVGRPDSIPLAEALLA